MAEDRRVLPLMDAYRFCTEHGLQSEMEAIRDMEIEWDLSYTSSLRRGYMIALLRSKQLYETFVDRHWPLGKEAWGKRKTEFWVSLKSRYEDYLEGKGTERDSDDLEEEESEQAFAAESDLRDFLAKSLESVEPGLKLYEKGDQSGTEFPVEDGRIDILATDKGGKFVVFELKLARGRNKALGQLLYYMGWIDANLGKGPCRGIIVAKEISEDLILAVRRVQGVSLYKYILSVSLERVDTRTPS